MGGALRRFLVAAYYMLFRGIGWTYERDPKVLAKFARHPSRLKRAARRKGFYRRYPADVKAIHERYLASLVKTPEEVAAQAAWEERQRRILMSCAICDITRFDEHGQPYGCPLHDDEWDHASRERDSKCHYTLDEFEAECIRETAVLERRLRDISSTLQKRRLLKEPQDP